MSGRGSNGKSRAPTPPGEKLACHYFFLHVITSERSRSRSTVRGIRIGFDGCGQVDARLLHLGEGPQPCGTSPGARWRSLRHSYASSGATATPTSANPAAHRPSRSQAWNVSATSRTRARSPLVPQPRSPIAAARSKNARR